jgi:hypothetical protein
MVLGAFALVMAACAAAVIPTAIHRAREHSARTATPPPVRGRVPPRGVLHLVPQALPLGRSALYGHWHANGVVTGGDGSIYRVGTRLSSRDWFFARTCRQHRCARRIPRTSTSGLLSATFHGRPPRWTASFPHYGSLICGSATRPVRGWLSARWRFTLTPNMSHLEAIERITSPLVCGSGGATIRWTALPAPARLLRAPAAASSHSRTTSVGLGAPNRAPAVA